MAAGKKIHRTTTTLADLADIGSTLEARKAKPAIKTKPDNRPTPETLAALVRVSPASDTDHLADILAACETAWSREELARFWSLLK